MTDFEHLAPDERTPHDAVVVEVTEIFGRTVADVTTIDEVATLPSPVHQALAKAEALRKQLGLRRIVIRIADEKLWNSDWVRSCSERLAQWRDSPYARLFPGD